MQYDPNNKMVQLCVEGMNAEAQGNIELAKQCFQHAWDIAADDFEAFTAAHYVARNQDNPNDALHWNKEALRLAIATGKDDIKPYYPSLYLNVAKSYETLGNYDEAAKYYTLAAECSSSLPAGKYGEMIKMCISEGLKRTNVTIQHNIALDGLIDNWCNTRQLKPLAIILPAYLGNLGTESDTNKLVSALHYLAAIKCLQPNDQQTVEGLIDTLVAPT